jgi:hypothetical protein
LHVRATDEVDIKTVVDLVPRVSFTGTYASPTLIPRLCGSHAPVAAPVPKELAWLKDTSRHFKTLASRKGVQDALETIFELASS